MMSNSIVLSLKDERKIRSDLKLLIRKNVFVPRSHEDFLQLKTSPRFPSFFRSNVTGYINPAGWALFYDVKKILFKSVFIKNNISSTTIRKNILDLIVKGVAVEEDAALNILIDEFLGCFAVAISQYNAVFPVTGMELVDINEFYVGQVKFAKSETFFLNNYQLALSKKAFLSNKTVAQCCGVVGDLDCSREKAFFLVAQAINVLRVLCLLGNWERSRDVQINISGYELNGSETVLLEDVKTRELTSCYDRGASPLHDVGISNKIVSEWKQGLLAQFDDLLNKHERSEIEKMLLIALYWLGEAINDPQRSSSFIKFIIALESLFLRKDKEKEIDDWLGKCVAVLVGKDAESMRDIYKEMVQNKGVYDLRSRIVHQGEVIERNVGRVAKIACDVFFEVLCLSKHGYETKDQLFREIDRLNEVIGLNN